MVMELYVGLAAVGRVTNLIAMPLLPELHNRNFVLARVFSKCCNPIILTCAYVPMHLIWRNQMLGTSPQFASFWEEGTRCSPCWDSWISTRICLLTRFQERPCRLLQMLDEPSWVLGANHMTRFQGCKASTLDYFLSKDVLLTNTKILGRFDKSDHKLIVCIY